MMLFSSYATWKEKELLTPISGLISRQFYIKQKFGLTERLQYAFGYVQKCTIIIFADVFVAIFVVVYHSSRWESSNKTVTLR